ncbi:MAG: hypothetical protein KF878_10160 [Planctomycetes bacterium]|nr:hypothetical protein [Planctomycetota bacterium]
MAWPFRPTLVLALLVLLTLAPARGQDEVRVLRARRALSYLSSNGNGASIYRAEAEVDLAVRSPTFAKDVGVRWSADGWRTFADAPAAYVGRLSDGAEHWRARVDLGTLGRGVRLGAERGDMGPAFVRLAAYLRAGGRAAWDNAGGGDHAAALLAPVAAPLPQARRAPAAVLVDGALHVVGGREREGYGFTVPDVLRLDPATGEWTRVAALPPIPSSPAGAAGPSVSPEVLAGAEVVAVGRRLFVLGGTVIKIGTRLTSTLVLDLDTRAWSVGPPLPAPLGDRRAVAVDGAVHLVPTSHVRGPGDTDRAFVLDAGASAWRQVAVAGLSLAAGTGYVAAAHDGRLFLLGGRVAGPAGAHLRDALAYDGRTRTLRRLGSLPVDLTGAEQAVVVGGQVLVANVEPDLGRGDAAALLFDPVAADVVRLPRRPLLPFEATLGPAPAALIAGPGGANPRRLHAALVFTGTSRVDTWSPEDGVLARGEARTVVRVQKDVGWGRRVTVRGEAAPLAWARGLDARWTAGDVWVFETTDLLEDVLVWKPLVDDRTWYPGADLRVRRGETLTTTW